MMKIAAPQKHKPGGWILPKHTVEVSEPFPEIGKLAGIFQEWNSLAVLTQLHYFCASVHMKLY
jgi:hypothetical protein